MTRSIADEGARLEMLRERYQDKAEAYRIALIRCQHCDDFLFEHGEVAFTSLVCSCDQSHRILNAYADDRLGGTSSQLHLEEPTSRRMKPPLSGRTRLARPSASRQRRAAPGAHH